MVARRAGGNSELHSFVQNCTGVGGCTCALTSLLGTGWANTEFRTYTFDPSSGDDAALVETEESQTRRRGIEKPLSVAEHSNLNRTVTNDLKEKESSKTEAQKNAITISSKV